MTNDQELDGQDNVVEGNEQTPDESTIEEGAAQDDTTDNRGVEWKNVAMEAQRKMELLEEKLARLEQQTLNQPGKSESQPVQMDPVAKVKEFAKDPDAYIDQKVQAIRRQDRLRDAEQWLRNQSPTNYAQTEKKVIAIMREYGIQAIDPVDAVQKAYRLLQKLTPSPKNDDTKRQLELQRKQTISGNKPKPPKANPITDLRKKACQSGDDADMTELFNQMFSPK